MNFLRKNLFLKLIKEFQKRKAFKQRHVAAPGRATWHADISMTSSGGSGVLTSAVGPADVSVDRSTVNGQGSGQRSSGPTGQPWHEADRWAPRVRPGKGKRKGSWFASGLKAGLGRLKAQLGLARLAASARPAAQQASSGSGLARLAV
jgi:hypothetical protein